MEFFIIGSPLVPKFRPMIALVAVAWVIGCSQGIAEMPCDACEPSGMGRCWNWCGWGCAHHLDPTGDMTTRVPYQSIQQYYYRRPYNATHVTQHGHGDVSATQSFSPRELPYANDAFDAIYQRVEKRAITEWSAGASRKEIDDVVLKDRPLEYIDWRKHRAARLQWDAESNDDFAAHLNMANALDTESDRPKSSRRTHQ